MVMQNSRVSAMDGINGRDRFRLFWTWKSRRRKPGRPPVSREIRHLVRRMSRENTRWGAPRIHGELLKLGFSISQAAVSKYMVRYPSPPSQSWWTFLTNHADCLASIDFFVVPTATFHLLFGFIVLHHERRQIVHFGVTANPTMAWVAQQIREAFPWGTAPRLSLPFIPSIAETLEVFASPPDTLSGMHKIIEIFADRAALHTEILALRQQVAVLKRKRPRPSLRKADRVFWVILSCLWPGWRHALVIVRPETVIGWHRKGFRLFWTWKSRRESRADHRCRGRSAIWSDGCRGRTHGGAHLGSMASF